jgi:hypothetical protein
LPRALRRAAAAAVLLVAGGVAGPALGERSRPGGEGTGVSGPAGPLVASTDIVPVAEVVDEPWVGLASFTDKDLFEAERDALLDKVGEYENRTRRIETELDFMRPLVEQTATASRIVESLRERVRNHAAAAGQRREDGGRMRDVWRHGRVAAMLLSRDRQSAYGPVRQWVQSAETPLERRTAIKLLAALRLPEGHDLLIEGTRDGVTRELALDGLLALRDPRSSAVFLAMMNDERLELDPTRLKAAGGLHRLGDRRGLDFLLASFRSHAGPPDLRRRIVFHVGANPSPPTRAVLPELLDGVRLDARDRAAMAEFLALSGVPDTDPALIRLLSGAGDREPRRFPERGPQPHRP